MEAEMEAEEKEFIDLRRFVCGHQVQVDPSGVGHAWRDIESCDIPFDIQTEIEGEIIDGGKETCEDFVGSNGKHYRWS